MFNNILLGMEGRQAPMGPGGIWRGGGDLRPLRKYLAPRPYSI